MIFNAISFIASLSNKSYKKLINTHFMFRCHNISKYCDNSKKQIRIHHIPVISIITEDIIFIYTFHFEIFNPFTISLLGVIHLPVSDSILPFYKY